MAIEGEAIARSRRAAAGRAGRAERLRTRSLVVIAATLVVALLKWSAAATVPIAFALFLVVLAWPLERKLERRLPRWAALATTLLTLFLLFALFSAALAWQGSIVAERAPQYVERAQQMWGELRGSLRGLGLAVGGGEAAAGGALDGTGGPDGIGGWIESLARKALHALTLIVLIAAFTVLGLLEVRPLKTKVRRAFSTPRTERLLETGRSIVVQYNRYLIARTIAGLITGAAVTVFCLVVGLEFAFVWGLMNFLLNYIPTLGSIVGIVPPVLFSLLQYDGAAMPLVVLAGVGGIQLLMGNYVGPLIQGRYLSLSPFIVLASIVFWGWVWGIPGALLGVPITVGVVVVADHFEQTHWIADLLAGADRIEERGGG